MADSPLLRLQVMVKVARGVEATPTHPQGEAMPMVIRMPHLGGGGSGSTGSSESMLGLGDIIVPALSTALLWRFDVAAGVPLGRFGRSLQSSAAVFKRSLFLPSLIGYVLALLCAYFAVVNFCVAQVANCCPTAACAPQSSQNLFTCTANRLRQHCPAAPDCHAVPFSLTVAVRSAARAVLHRPAFPVDHAADRMVARQPAQPLGRRPCHAGHP